MADRPFLKRLPFNIVTVILLTITLWISFIFFSESIVF